MYHFEELHRFIFLLLLELLQSTSTNTTSLSSTEKTKSLMVCFFHTVKLCLLQLLGMGRQHYLRVSFTYLCLSSFHLASLEPSFALSSRNGMFHLCDRPGNMTYFLAVIMGLRLSSLVGLPVLIRILITLMLGLEILMCFSFLNHF